MDGDDGCAFILVECVERCRVGLAQKLVRLYCWVLEFKASCYWCSMQHEVVMSLSCAVQIHYNGDDGDNGCTFIFVKCMARCCFYPGRTGGTFVLVCVWISSKLFLVFDAVRARDLNLMCCPNTLQWRWRSFVYLRWMHGTMSCWLWTYRKYDCIGVCLNFKQVVIGVRCSTSTWSQPHVLF